MDPLPILALAAGARAAWQIFDSLVRHNVKRDEVEDLRAEVENLRARDVASQKVVARYREEIRRLRDQSDDAVRARVRRVLTEEPSSSAGRAFARAHPKAAAVLAAMTERLELAERIEARETRADAEPKVETDDERLDRIAREELLAALGPIPEIDAIDETSRLTEGA